MKAERREKIDEKDRSPLRGFAALEAEKIRSEKGLKKTESGHDISENPMDTWIEGSRSPEVDIGVEDSKPGGMEDLDRDDEFELTLEEAASEEDRDRKEEDRGR